MSGHEDLMKPLWLAIIIGLVMYLGFDVSVFWSFVGGVAALSVMSSMGF